MRAASVVTFLLVRDPCARAASAFYFCRGNATVEFADFLRNPDALRESARHRSHWWPQVAALKAMGVGAVDFVLRVEELGLGAADELVAVLNARRGLLPPLPPFPRDLHANHEAHPPFADHSCGPQPCHDLMRTGPFAEDLVLLGNGSC